jgi:hypothetical protein
VILFSSKHTTGVLLLQVATVLQSHKVVNNQRKELAGAMQTNPLKGALWPAMLHPARYNGCALSLCKAITHEIHQLSQSEERQLIPLTETEPSQFSDLIVAFFKLL